MSEDNYLMQVIQDNLREVAEGLNLSLEEVVEDFDYFWATGKSNLKREDKSENKPSTL